MTRLASILLLLCVSAPLWLMAQVPLPPNVIVPDDAGPQPLTNSVAIAWSSTNVGGQFLVWCGTSSGVYLTNWTTTNTTFRFPTTWLYPGSNFIAVSWQQVRSNSAAVSDPSNEIVIERRQSFPIWISAEIQGSTNLQSWSVPAKFYIGTIAADLPQQFFRGQLHIETLERDQLIVRKN